MKESGNDFSIDEMTVSEATSRLISLILKMPPREIINLLKTIEENGFEKKRESPRESYFMDVDFVVRDRAYNGYIKNISSEGVFIETKENFPAGTNITLSFSLPNSKGHIRANGKITRQEKDGFSVAFDMDIQTILENRDEALKLTDSGINTENENFLFK